MQKLQVHKVAVMAFAAILMTSVGALAKDKNHHNVVFPETVRIGSAQLAAGEYKMEWNESGSKAEVTFLQRGKTIAQVPAKIVNLSRPAANDSVTMKTGSDEAGALEQVEFGGQKEAFLFGADQNAGE